MAIWFPGCLLEMFMNFLVILYYVGTYVIFLFLLFLFWPKQEEGLTMASVFEPISTTYLNTNGPTVFSSVPGVVVTWLKPLSEAAPAIWDQEEEIQLLD